MMNSSPKLAEVLEIPKKRAKYGEGGAYQRPNGTWQIAFYDDQGRRRKESYSTEAKARKMLARKIALREAGKLDEAESRAKLDTLAELYVNKCRGTAPKSIAWIERVWNKHLKPFFSGYRAERIDTALLVKYQTERLESGAAPATVNRELAILRATFYYAYEQTPPKVSRVPKFPEKLKESKPRSGFLTDAQYDALQANCKHPSIRAMMSVAYNFGFRKSELRGLRVKQVDMKAKTISLLPGETKNDEGRTIVMTDDVYAHLLACVRDKKPEDFVFTWPSGKPVRDFRVAWNQMCKAAGVSILLHDFRRSAVRNMIRGGVSQDVAKKISGHVTDEVFSRYNITDMSDLKDASRKIQNRRQPTTSKDAQR
jgi:integrase